MLDEFLKLKIRNSSRCVYVRLDCIIAMEEQGASTQVYLIGIGENTFDVSNSVEEIEQMMKSKKYV